MKEKLKALEKRFKQGLKDLNGMEEKKTCRRIVTAQEERGIANFMEIGCATDRCLQRVFGVHQSVTDRIRAEIHQS